MQVFREAEVLICIPPLVLLRKNGGARKREADFEESQFRRFLHLLNDSPMTMKQPRLMERSTRANLDSEPVEVWSENIAILFDDEPFEPVAFRGLAGGILFSDIAGLDPSKIVCMSHGSVLKRNFRESK